MTTKQLDAVKAELKKVQGIELNGKKLRIVFQYQGKRIRENTDEQLNKLGVRAAFAKRARILEAIAKGEFVFADFFPNSKRAAQFDTATGTHRTVAQGIDMWLKIVEGTAAPCTYRNYKSKALIHVEPKWGTRLMHTVTTSELLGWRQALLNDGYSTKTVNDIFTVVRQVFGAGFVDGVCDTDPCARIKNIKRDASQDSNADPFTLEELNQLTLTKTRRESEKNMILFACWMGLSISELLAMAWEDVDFDRGCITIRRALVDGEFKVPKEQSRNRTIPILNLAMPWLKAQRAISELLPPITRDVLQRDNREKVAVTFRPVWVNSRSQEHHANDWVVSKRFLEHFCYKAGVRYRPANQCRHTFASRMLTDGMDPHMVARHMGHSGTTMLYKHYAKWIDQDVDYHNHPLNQAQK